jgi:replicative DNA helicase
MIMIDYIQKMNDGIKANSSNKNLEVGNISNGLKNLAKELDCPVVALSQLNRSLESRTDKRPNNSDLRDSGSLEQDADVIQFLYRDEVYDPGSTSPGVMEVITSKFRDGEIGTDRLLFEGQFNSVSDMDAAKFMQQQQEAEQSKPAKFAY